MSVHRTKKLCGRYVFRCFWREWRWRRALIFRQRIVYLRAHEFIKGKCTRRQSIHSIQFQNRCGFVDIFVFHPQYSFVIHSCVFFKWHSHFEAFLFLYFLPNPNLAIKGSRCATQCNNIFNRYPAIIVVFCMMCKIKVFEYIYLKSEIFFNSIYKIEMEWVEVPSFQMTWLIPFTITWKVILTLCIFASFSLRHLITKCFVRV